MARGLDAQAALLRPAADLGRAGHDRGDAVATGARDLAALTGETADNLPAVPGVGPGFAAKWINAYGGLEGVLENADSITGKKGEALRAHLDDVAERLGDRLNTKVRITLAAKKGQIIVDFATIQDLNRILAEIGETEFGAR